jgi:5-oxopent-3-ene-1,2,5-tricarboxylate decarboxylase/2-hydroxyhepta-2,4-diene-1,7-dioate isomerase
VVIVPAQLAEEVAHEAVEQEAREAWALERVKDGESIRGIYPLSPERRPEYDRWRADRDGDRATTSRRSGTRPSPDGA